MCRTANSLVKEGYTKSAAFVKAWALIKIEAINNKLFSLNMVDRQSAAAEMKKVLVSPSW